VLSAVRSWQEDDDETYEAVKRSRDGLTPSLWIAFIVSAAHPSPPVL
jgi:hypothetical protein